MHYPLDGDLSGGLRYPLFEHLGTEDEMIDLLYFYVVVDGRWSNWGGWTSCSKSCGTGFKERFRSCTRPAPKFGGKPCTGEVRETHECNNHPCPGKTRRYNFHLRTQTICTLCYRWISLKSFIYVTLAKFLCVLTFKTTHSETYDFDRRDLQTICQGYYLSMTEQNREQ